MIACWLWAGRIGRLGDWPPGQVRIWLPEGEPGHGCSGKGWACGSVLCTHVSRAGGAQVAPGRLGSVSLRVGALRPGQALRPTARAGRNVGVDCHGHLTHAGITRKQQRKLAGRPLCSRASRGGGQQRHSPLRCCNQVASPSRSVVPGCTVMRTGSGYQFREACLSRTHTCPRRSLQGGKQGGEGQGAAEPSSTVRRARFVC